MGRRTWQGLVWGASGMAGLMTLAACGLAAGPASPSPLPPLATQTVTATALPATETPAATPTPACSETAGQVLEDHYPGMLVKGEVPFRIYLPACAASAGERLPVLYLFHGYPFDESQWDVLGIDETVESWIQAEQAPPFALVMPRLPEPLFRGPKSGGAGSYEAEMLQGLLPAVEAKYPVAISPERRAIAGISRGGVWSLEIGMRHPEVFAAVAALSPALSVNYASPAYDPLVLAAGTAPLPERFYLAAGADDWARPKSEELAQALQASGKPVELAIVPGGHTEAAWLAAIPSLLTYVLDGW
jgi:enterochelin esterase-like enzyme